MGTIYLSKENLAGFEKYKYSSIDSSYFSNNVMHPFWNWCIQFCPKWVAPNVLTFIGFLLTALNFLIFSYYDYEFYNTSNQSNVIPSWIWVLSSINQFVAYTLDGIDGKQARKTGTSGPLGELFDHGLDSYSSVMIPTCMFSIFGRAGIPPLRMYFLLWNIFINFYLTHWEKYNTGVLFLPWGYDFTMIGAVLTLLITAIIGQEGWNVDLPGGLNPALILEFSLYVSAIITSQTMIIWNIYKSYRDKTGKMRTFIEAIRPLIPLFLSSLIGCTWAIYSQNNIVDKDPRIFFLLSGTLFSNICCRLIVAQMSDTRCDIFNTLLYPFLVVTVICTYVPISPTIELRLLYLMWIGATIAHIHYGVGVVTDMCNHFKIRCFKIKPKNKET